VIVPSALLTIAPETLRATLMIIPSLFAVIFCVLVMPPWNVVTLPMAMPLLPVMVPELTMPPPALAMPNRSIW
jgi:hypothetical protein